MIVFVAERYESMACGTYIKEGGAVSITTNFHP